MTTQEFEHAYEKGYRSTVLALKRRETALDEVEDLAQSAWLKGWQSLGRLRDEQRLNSWIAVIAANLMRSHFRRRPLMDQLQIGMEPVDGSTTRVASIEISIALEHCSPRQRRLLELVYIEGYSCTEVALQTGRSPGAIHAELYRARKSVREYMQAPRRQVLPDDGVLLMKGNERHQ